MIGEKGEKKILFWLPLETKSDSNDTHADESNIDGESDSETKTSMITDSKPLNSQGYFVLYTNQWFFMSFTLVGSSGLLLLAAAAEQKQKDEAGKRISFVEFIWMTFIRFRSTK